AAAEPNLAAVTDRLEGFITASSRLPVHDFYARILGAQGGRRRLLARLGHEAGEILDEFLTFALEQEETGLPGLQAFLSTLDMEAPTVKREQDKGRDEVRIMTVHAAKGLEAPVVFLVDSGGKAFNATHMPHLRFVDGEHGGFPVWLPLKALANSVTDADAAELRSAAEEEYRRLLYVAMTRAADRLVVCGYRGQRENPDTWHAMIVSALSADESRCSETAFSAGADRWNGLRWREAGSRAPAANRLPERQIDPAAPLPETLGRPLPPQRNLPRPLSPSGAAAVVDTSGADLIVPSALFARGTGSSRAAERGRLLHRFLQILPTLPAGERQAAARRYLDRAAQGWPAAERAALIASATAVMDDPSLAPIFAATARAEVSIMGTLTLGRADYAVSGRIDRMATTGEAVEIVDFKTNRLPPASLDAIPFEHRAQLAIYRAILAPLYPGRPVRCGLIYTEGPAVYWLPDAMLSASLAELATK
ncbi:PD-(D/E)XK nuclease family protein, partial [Rhizobium sp. TRM95111]|uniref:3'-5' exonuclease n=1 Tax=Rhizobium alarense TaxID=2846851 RepID=UPI001F330140